MVNGLIFQKNNDYSYKGVEGDNWYLNDIYPDTIGNYYDNYIAKSWYKSNWVDVCSDEAFMKNYIDLSRKNRLDFRIILCQTDCDYPKIGLKFDNLTYLGYDYAYPGGSYYSAIFSDIYSRNIEEFSGFKLNQNGLLSDRDDIERFIKLRNTIMSNCINDNLFEKGNFITYKLYQIQLV